jgi:transposase
MGPPKCCDRCPKQNVPSLSSPTTRSPVFNRLPPPPQICRRLGTVTLSAAVDLVTGVVHHAITQRHRSREFVAFLQKLDTAYAVGVLICILLDNHSAHRSREARRFLATKPGRFELVFTPTHASWLHRVETYFSKMSRSVPRRIHVTSKEELRDRIQRYIETGKECPLVPNGPTASTVTRSLSLLDSIHHFGNGVLDTLLANGQCFDRRLQPAADVIS